jgi:hypothetical protein
MTNEMETIKELLDAYSASDTISHAHQAVFILDNPTKPIKNNRPRIANSDPVIYLTVF